MFHVELAPVGGIFGPLKSDLGVFWPFRATDFIMGILKIAVENMFSVNENMCICLRRKKVSQLPSILK